MKRFQATLSVLVATLALSGCWQTKQKTEVAVFSDDGTEIAYLVHHFEEATRGTPRPQVSPFRNHSVELRARNVDGTNDRQITAPRPGTIHTMPTGSEVGRGFYAMRCAGYWIVPTHDDDGSLRVTIHRNGQVQTVGHIGLSTFCDELEVIPSPDASILARVITRGGCPPGSGPPTPGGEPPAKVEVTFLDPSTLQVLGNQTIAGVGAGAEATWTVAGTLEVVAPNGEVWSLDPTTGAIQQTNTPPSCAKPRTTSSFIAADGRTVEAKNGQIVLGQPGQHFPGAQPFGCGAHASLQISCP